MELYRKPAGVHSRWITFENSTGAKGRGAMENRGGKGHACEPLAAGETKVLCDVHQAGVIRRIWMTCSDRSPKLLRSLRVEMWWDEAKRPAVSCPLGDFFGIAHGHLAAHWNALFSSPEGRSFNCTIPMPFRKHGRITITNESAVDVRLFFYEVDCELVEKPSPLDLYFHAIWRRERPTVLGRDFEILPRVVGEGRFLGCNLGVIADAVYGKGWWGEGEVKVYLDGDQQWPTLVGTGAEDYVGTGWGMDVFFHPHQGCSLADRERGRWAFYRYHLPDAVYFESDCRVAIQSMGGMPKREVAAVQARGGKVKPATVAGKQMLENPQSDISDASFAEDAWCNHYREDDYCATAYFYLDRPENTLPELAGVPERVAGLPDTLVTKRADV